MRVLIDTNVLFSAILNAKSRVARAVFYANENCDVVLSEQNVWELREIVRRKMPRKLGAMERLLERLDFELIASKKMRGAEEIRDEKDQPILDAARQNDVDIILTGDKDFLVLKMKKPKCMTVAEFLEKYANDEER